MSRALAVDAAAGRADLFRALDQDGDDGLTAMASLLGYEALPRRVERPIPAVEVQEPSTEAVVKSVPAPDTPSSFAPIPYWRPVAAELSESERLTGEPEPPEERDVEILREADLVPLEEVERPARQPIVAWPRLWRVLNDRLRTPVPRSEIDALELVDRWARGENVEPLPRLAGLTHSRVVLVLDQSPRLAPFRIDLVDLAGELLRRLGPASVRLVAVHGTEDDAISPRGDALADGDQVLALSDLGSYGDRESRAFWRRLGRWLRRSNVPALALVPCPAARWPRWTAELWSAFEWSSPDRPATAGGEASSEPVEDLICLAAPAIRLEAGLLRDLRRLVPGADLDTETALWSHPAVASKSWRGLSLDPEEVRRRWPAFMKQPEATRRAVIECLQTWHAGLTPEVWAEEVVGLVAHGVPEDWLGHETVERATGLIEKIGALVEQGRGAQLAPETEAWFGRFTRRAARPVWGHRRFRRPLGRAMAALKERNEETPSPVGTTPEMFIASIEREVERWSVWQEGAGFRLRPMGEAGEGSRLASIGTREPKLSVSDGIAADRELILTGERPLVPWPESDRPVEIVSDVESVCLERWQQPEWASASGRDEHGLWASFEVDGVAQRMRLITPGRFQMGSPETEAGRVPREGPRHWVVLTEGYWLADTPCTQALWEAVMDANPSKFVSRRRPVERVSWDDCQDFLDRLNGRIRGLEVWLPTEAEWEYACRAGMDTATWLGDLEILGLNNAPLLDEIAWYGGNSGVDFDLEEGVDSSEWEKKQQPHTRAGTRNIGLKRPNPWGLYDMLGNVYEWCWDVEGPYTEDVGIDPEGPARGAMRVCRGGSWIAHAHRVRAACRYWSVPGSRALTLGFRVSRGQGRGALAERASEGSERARRGTSPRRRSRRSRAWVERLGWAADGGTDEIGRWASFEIGEVVQRMRWILPGRFLMGAPETEVGRYSAEAPRHEVTLTEGFWLAETPCTQELWQAVTGENPSFFVSPRRPVEQVSWEDCQRFFERLNALIPELRAGFPTEAQWEYACRAGSTTATWLGDLRILGERNAPLLDTIAWYGGNSGVSFDLQDGVDSSGWRETQYSHTRVGTHEVGRKRPNPWGLFDMLGNVWEWCSDYWADTYPGGPRSDPTGPHKGTGRVGRGGSWDGHARSVRAAYRSWSRPGNRGHDLGFRVSRGQGR